MVKSRLITSIIILFLLFSISSQLVFFSIFAFFNQEYLGSTSSNIYLFIMGANFFINFIIFLGFFFTKGYLSKSIFFFISLFAFYFLSFIFYMIFSKIIDSNAILFFLSFVVLATPAILSGFILSYFNFTNYIILFCKILLFTIVIGVTNEVLIPFFSGSLPPIVSFGGSSYQYLSYASAYAFGLNLYFYLSNHYFKSKLLSKILYYFILSVLLFSVIFSGGRGGILLILAYYFYFLFFSSHVVKLKARYLLIEYLFIIILLFILNPNFIYQFLDLDGWSRIFEYLNDDLSINWSGTSGRDEIFLEAISFILLRPIFGYGVFDIFNFIGYPHNFFLEILLSGGFAFLILFLLFTIKIIYPVVNRLIKRNSIIVVIGIYPFVNLLFSGSYLANSEFWFVLSFVVSSFYIYGKKSLTFSF